MAAARTNTLQDGAAQARGGKAQGGRAGLRRWRRVAVLGALAAALAACGTVPPGGAGRQAPVTQGQQAKPATTKIVVLLPLSGQSAALGRTLLNAAEMALFDIADERLELVPRDTGGTPQAAAAAAQRAISEGAAAIIGPLFAPEAAAVRPIAAAAGVEMLTFTTDRRLASPGSHVLGLAPGDQIDRIIGFARAGGAARLAVLAPRNPYGDVATAAAQESAGRYGAQIVRVERYDPNLTDLSVPAQALAQLTPPPQAAFIADGGQPAQAMARAVREAGLQQTQLLGAGLWDEPGLGSEPALVGGRFAAPDPAARADFESRYKALFGEKPHRIATLAYDAAALAATVARRGATLGKPLDRSALTSFDYNGADGPMRLQGNGSTRRGLAVLEITPEGARVVDPAPRTLEFIGQ